MVLSQRPIAGQSPNRIGKMLVNGRFTGALRDGQCPGKERPKWSCQVRWWE